MTTQQKNQKDLAPSHPSYLLIIRLGVDDHDAPESFPTSLQKILILQVFRHVTSTGYLASKSARIVAGLLAGPSGPSFVTNGLCQKQYGHNLKQKTDSIKPAWSLDGKDRTAR